MLKTKKKSYNNINNLPLQSSIILCFATAFYILSIIGIISLPIGISFKWVSLIILLFILALFRLKKSLFLLNQPLTITFLILTFMEGINLLTNISFHTGGLVTLLAIASISFVFYNLPLYVLEFVLSCIYYCVIILIILSAFQGLSGLTIIQLSPEIGEYIEKNSHLEQITRFRGVFANPNTLAIYSLLVISWVFAHILELTTKTKHWFRTKSFSFLLLIGASALYCGLATLSLQFPTVIFLVIIGLRFFNSASKLSLKRILFEILIIFLICFVGYYLFELYLATPQQRTSARFYLFAEAFSKTDRWYLFGYGFGQNNIENLTIDIGPLKWLLELGLLSLFFIIVCILHTLINFQKLKNNKFNLHKVYIYYTIYINLISNWLFQNIIYSPLYITTSIWILLSVIIHKMERESRNTNR